MAERKQNDAYRRTPGTATLDVMNDEFWSGGLPAAKHKGSSCEKELFVEMRDGTRLSTDVLLPEGAVGPLPCLLVRTPYDKDKAEGIIRNKWSDFFLGQGYAVVVQNERGFYLSEGAFDDYLQGARTDGVDTIDWIVSQPWSNGKVGTLGCSSSAEHQWALAAGNHPAHAAMIPAASGTAVGDVPGNDTRGAFYRGGIPQLESWVGWFGRLGVTERLVLPAETTQEQRLRLRNFYALSMRSGFAPDTPERLRHLPSGMVLRQAEGPLAPFDKYITWTPADPRWEAVDHIGKDDRLRVPALHLNTWHDMAVGETVRLYEHLQERETPNQFLIIASGPHCLVWHEPPYVLTKATAKELVGAWPGDVASMPAPDISSLTFGDLTVGDVRYRGVDHGYAKLFVAWFDHWLKDEANGVTSMPRVQLHVMNRGWIASDTWPPRETTRVPYYLGEEGALSKSEPTTDGADTYLYDPLDPTPSLGGGFGFAAAIDQRPISARRDVRLYSTPPLDAPVTVVGPVEVVLHVSSSAKDTDFIVRLVDVHPDGRAINLTDDGFRMRYRDGFCKKVLMKSGDVYEITLPNMVTGNCFLAGHRIRIEISSSSFPAYERNLNTGGNNYDESEPLTAENTIHRGPTHPSRVVLRVLPD